MVMQLKGKVCIVTGSSSRIGEATPLGLGALGASVVAVMRGQSPKAESAIRKIEARSKNGGGSFSAIYADLSSQSSIRQLAQDFDKRFDRLDVLINNAGVNHSKRIVLEHDNRPIPVRTFSNWIPDLLVHGHPRQHSDLYVSVRDLHKQLHFVRAY